MLRRAFGARLESMARRRGVAGALAVLGHTFAILHDRVAVPADALSASGRLQGHLDLSGLGLVRIVTVDGLILYRLGPDVRPLLRLILLLDREPWRACPRYCRRISGTAAESSRSECRVLPSCW